MSFSDIPTDRLRRFRELLGLSLACPDGEPPREWRLPSRGAPVHVALA